MKINLSKKQYERLIKLLFIGEYVVNGYKDEEDEDYAELLQYFYSFSKEMGMDSHVEYDKQYNRYFETREFEDDLLPMISEYEEASFLDEYIGKVTSVVFIRKYGENHNLSAEEAMEKFEDIQEKVAKYLDEEGFEKSIEKIITSVLKAEAEK